MWHLGSALSVAKSSTTTQIATAGQSVPYRFVVSNLGNTTLTNISVTDAKCDAAPVYLSGDSNSDSKLQITESWTYTCSHTVSQAEVDAGGNLSNTVTADSDQTQPTTDTLDIPINQNSVIEVVKTSSTTQVTTAGQVVPYRFAVSNPGNTTLTGIAISDAKCDAAPVYDSGDSNSDNKLQITETWIFTCSHTVSQAEIDAGGTLTNTVTVDSDQTTPTTDTLNIPIEQNPVINVVKTSSTTQVTAAGQVVPYRFVVSNLGNTTLTGITISDAKCDAAPAYASGDSNSDSKLQIAESWTFTCSHTVTQAEIDGGGNLTNTVTVDSDQTPSTTDSLNIPVIQSPQIKVIKTSSTAEVTTLGQVVVYSFAVSNPGNTTLTGITVSDAKCNAAPVYASGDSNTDNKLQITETWTFTCSHTVSQAEIDGGGNLSNTVTADSDQTQPTTSTLDIPINQNSVIKVDKTSATTQVTSAGQIVVYNFAVSNPGNTTLTNITVTDAKCNAAPAYVSGDSNNDSKLQTSEIWHYTCSHTVSQAESSISQSLRILCLRWSRHRPQHK